MSGFNHDIDDESVICPFCHKNIPILNKDIHIPRCQKFKRTKPSETASESDNNNDNNKNNNTGINNEISTTTGTSSTSNVINRNRRNINPSYSTSTSAPDRNIIPLLDESVLSEPSAPPIESQSQSDVIFVDSANTSIEKIEGVSHSHGHTMNGDGNQWPCVACTYLNSLSTNVCGACGSLMPGSDTIPVETGDTWQYNTNSITTNNNRSDAISEGNTADSRHWKCDSCTFSENTRSSHHCSMCGR